MIFMSEYSKNRAVKPKIKGNLINIDPVLDYQVKQIKKVNNIKELVKNGRYKIDEEKLSKILYETMASETDPTP
jgi:hypothetical protein